MFEYIMGLVGALFSIKKFQLASNQAKSEAISSLRHALRLTTRHIQETRVGEFGEIGFNDVESRELSDAWSRVACAIRPFNRSLAKTFEDKSDYWLNPDGFRNDIQEGRRRFNYRMRITEVLTELGRIENGGL
jgi:hypothetical protein